MGRLPKFAPAAPAVPLTLLCMVLTGCTIPPEHAAGSVRSDQATAFELPPFEEAREALAELEELDLPPVQREALKDLQAAMRQIDISRRLVYHWPMIVLRVREPAELRAGPSFEAPKVADLGVGSHVVTFNPFSTWVEIEVIEFPAHLSLLHRDPGPPINWRGAGFVHQNRLEFDAAARSRFNSDVFLRALAAFQDRFTSAGSADCFDDLQACKPRGAEFDCELVMIVCLGEAFMGRLG